MRVVGYSCAAATTEAYEKTFSSPPAIVQLRSPLHSPVPYLFGGLAAMLGLIGFALLILACSYRRLFDRLHDNRGGDQRDSIESGSVKGEGSGKAEKVYEEKILVIMAGQEKPTFLATPALDRTFSIAEITTKRQNKEEEAAQSSDKMTKEMNNNQNDSTTSIADPVEENRETRESQQTQ